MLIQLARFMSDEELHSMEDQVVPSDDENHDAMTTEIEEGSVDTLSSLQVSLKKARWNVFMFLGIAFLMFAFALFPMPMNADFELGTAEKDLGFVWGPSPAGEDFMDVPYEVSVAVKQLPPFTGNITLQVYVLKIDDCTNIEEASAAESKAQQGNDHDFQYLSVESPVEGKTYTFDFDLDMGEYCLNVKTVDDYGTVVDPSRTDLTVSGKLWPNQVIAGVPGLIFLGLSTFAFIGAQKIGKRVKALLEDEKLTEEQLVLEEARRQKIAAGPAGPPKSVAGPGGPPKTVAGPSGAPPSNTQGPANVAAASTTSVKTGPPPAQSTPVDESIAVAPAQEDGSTFEDAGNGYFYRKMANGGYEQQIYIKNSNGQYIPYQAQ